MGDTFTPETPAQVQQTVAWAVDAEIPLEVIGCGTKRAIGAPSATEHILDLSGLSDIQSYQPEELILIAGPGTKLAEIEMALMQSRQQLAFEPADLGPLLGQPAEQGTLGGVIGCNLSGPRRIQAGAVRDHFLGFSAVSGRGESFKAGGKVVKNVTGYDLCKLICGSWGTLAVMTEICVKILPMPDRTRTVLIFGCSLEQAGAAMARALQSPHEVSGAAHLPADAAAQSRVGFVSKAAEAVTAIRIEGTGISVDYRCEMLLKELSELGETEELHTANSQSLWAELRDVLPFAGSDDARAVWRISVPPAEGPRLAATLVDATDGHVYLDWGGGLIWLAVEEGSDAHAQTVREKISPSVGHATLIRASEAVRSKVSVFPKPAWIALSHRVKEGFDPKSILNPGRLVEGI